MQKNDVKKQFPIFQHKIHGKDLIYFDSASTAQVPQSVLDAMNQYYTTYKSNVGRGIYQIAEQATLFYAQARQTVAQFIGAKKDSIIFTSGATESLNLVAQGWAAHYLNAGDEIVISQVEHHSNFVPWQQLSIQRKLKLVIVPVGSQGTVDSQEFQKYLSPKTKLVSIVHTSNVTGGTNDVVTLTKMAHAIGAKVLIDAAQSVVHQKIDVLKIGCDFLVFSGHKLFGPTGIGVLYATEPMMKMMQVQKFGGGMVFSVGQDASEFKSYPDCFEAGTPNVAGVIGLAAAIDFVHKNVDFKIVSAHETTLVQKLALGLSKFQDIEIISFVPSKNDAHSVSMLTFYSKKHHAHDIASHLDQFGICVRAGHHCTQPFHEKRNINASVRVSFALYNTEDEVEYFLDCLQKLY